MEMTLIILLFALLTLASSSVVPSNPDLFPIPTIDYEDLLSLKEDAVDRVVQHLTTIGTIQIGNIPSFPAIREQALSGSAECLKSVENVEKRVMSDGSIRYSSGAKTIDGVASPMDNQCGMQATRLRALIDAVCRQLFVALDSQIGSHSDLLMAPSYRRFSDLMNKGSHLEHLHSYFPPPESRRRREQLTMDFHSDAGLMIAMTTGYFTHGPPSPQSGLYLRIPDDDSSREGGERTVKAVLDDNCLVILMGEGSKHWLKNPILGGGGGKKTFRPVPHALLVDFQPNDLRNSRAWFGKMYLPPADAILPVEGVTFSRQRQREADFQSINPYTASASASASDSLPLACGGSWTSQVVLQNQPCDEAGVAGVYCWTQCQPVTDLPCGQAAVCVDTNTGEVIEDGKNVHCTDGGVHCELQCVSSDETNSTTYSDYCYGYGTTMSMNGFFSLVQDSQGSTPCVNLWFEDWTLDDEGKFAAACLGVFLLGIVIQYLTVLRGATKKIGNPVHRRVGRVLAFGSQVVLSYFLMLVAMTYSVELFCMVVAGLTTGYALFHSSDERDPTAISADACCPEEKGYDRLVDDVINPM